MPLAPAAKTVQAQLLGDVVEDKTDYEQVRPIAQSLRAQVSILLPCGVAVDAGVDHLHFDAMAFVPQLFDLVWEGLFVLPHAEAEGDRVAEKEDAADAGWFGVGALRAAQALVVDVNGHATPDMGARPQLPAEVGVALE